MMAAALRLAVNTARPRRCKSKYRPLAIVYRLAQLAIFFFIVIYVVIIQRGYQEFDNAEGAVTVKVKGVFLTNLTDGPLKGRRVWDVADYVKPAEENSAFFIMTNAIVTPRQNQSTCPENPAIGNCTQNADCVAGSSPNTGSGVQTGNCVNSDKPGVKTCELYAWCPVEEGDPAGGKNASLIKAQNFTVYIRNSVIFPTFIERRMNIHDNNDDDYLSRCDYNSKRPEDLCPIFTVQYILNEAESDPQQQEFMLEQGGIIEIVINWDCNFDVWSSNCLPDYQFRRIDIKNTKGYPGYNFRYAEYYSEHNVDMRTLYKAYGLRFIVVVNGKGGRFSFFALFMNIGSSLSYFGGAVFLCDLFVSYYPTFCKKELVIKEILHNQNGEGVGLLETVNGTSSHSS